MEDNVLNDELNNEDVLADDSIFEDDNTTNLMDDMDDEDDVDFDSFDDSTPDW